jgi:NADPH2:quinone reductase
MSGDLKHDTLAVVADPGLPHRFEIRAVENPRSREHEAIVTVKAFSLNAGEVRDAMSSTTVRRPGWDFAGVVERAAADGTGPSAGTRVVGLSWRSGAWAQRVAVPTNALAVIPDGVSFGEAAALPVAGLTALYGISKAGLLLGKSVLIAGASGSVGRFACRLAVLSGAKVTALVRAGAIDEALRSDGVHEVVVGDQSPLKQRDARFSLVFETQGGESLAHSVTLLAEGGLCVVCGNASNQPTTFDVRQFYHQGRVSLMGFYLGSELKQRPACEGLALLVELVADKRLRPPIEIETSWSEIARIADRFTRREIRSKAVLHIDG